MRRGAYLPSVPGVPGVVPMPGLLPAGVTAVPGAVPGMLPRLGAIAPGRPSTFGPIIPGAPLMPEPLLPVAPPVLAPLLSIGRLMPLALLPGIPPVVASLRLGPLSIAEPDVPGVAAGELPMEPAPVLCAKAGLASITADAIKHIDRFLMTSPYLQFGNNDQAVKV